MKRIITLALAACMIFGAAFNASAADIKASGGFWVGYDYVNTDNTGKTNDFIQRFRAQIDIIASENLSGTVFFEINNTWGQANDKVGPGSGGALGADGVNVQTRRAYIDFVIPQTAVKVRAGIQGLALPGAVLGSPVLADDVAAIVASGAINPNISLTGFFARPYDADESQTTIDLFGGIVNADLGMVNVSPYFVFANAGDKAQKGSSNQGDLTFNEDAQWYGVALEVTPMPNLILSLDGVYGKASGTDAGFLVAGKAAYTTDYFVPAIVGWYASGNDSDGEGLMPTIDGQDFAPATLVGEGATGITSDAIFGDALGKWGVSLQADEITFIERVSHTARVTYVRGTNDDSKDIKNWGEDDSAVEFDLVTTYSMYDNLDFIVDLAYVATDFDDGAAEDVDDVFKAGILAQYSF